jgi:hypothetical protein
MTSFDTFTSFAIVLLAALIHASFQLSISVLTLLSGHALGRKTAHTRLLRLASGFILGATVMTVLLLSTSSFVLNAVLPTTIPVLAWSLCCGAVIGVALSVWFFYYRDEPGTSLWIPRSLARHLGDRTKATKDAGEAFSLGLTSIISEIIFIFAPILVASLALIHLDPQLQLAGVLLYAFVSLLPLFVVGTLIGGGHKLSGIQRWRESNKHFLQFAAGTGLLVLGAYVYVNQVLVVSVAAAGMN